MGCIPHDKNRHISTFGKSVPCRDESVTPVISAAADDDHRASSQDIFSFISCTTEAPAFSISTDSGSPYSVMAR